MNLALQTRRAVITLSLMAFAMVCVVAKTATGNDALSTQVTLRVERAVGDTAAVSVKRVAVSNVANAKACREIKVIGL